jgi:plastocyanin
MKIRLLAPVLMVSGLGLAACGGGSSSSSDATVPADADLVVTAVDGLKWDKDSYTAAAGDVLVATVNNSGQPHNLHMADASNAELPTVLDLPSRGTVATGTYTLTAGTYTIFCTIPGHANMRATLEVS